MFRVELLKALHRLRTYVFGVGLALLAVLPVVFPPGAEEADVPFFDLLTRNGLFASLVAVALLQPFFLPLGTGLLSGDSIAGEASGGTLRYLLVRPVGRIRLVVAKYASTMVQVAAGVVWVMVVGLVAGGIAYGYAPLPTLSGTVLGPGEAALRIAGAGLYVLLGVAGLGAIGVFLSTLTTSGPGAAVATVGLGILSQILDSLSALRVIHPYLLSHRWLAFVDLFRSPVEWSAILHGLALAGGYTAVFLVAAVLTFNRKDVLS
jgi:ABC-2 type transport system permease protein